MKKILVILVSLVLGAGLASAQSVEVGVSVDHSQEVKKTEKEDDKPTQMKMLEKMARRYPTRFMLYPTTTSYEYYELETTTGRLWWVRIKNWRKGTMRSLAVNPDVLIGADEEEKIGRFELYPTGYGSYVMLIDTQTGRLWLIEEPSSPNSKKNLITPIDLIHAEE